MHPGMLAGVIVRLVSILFEKSSQLGGSLVTGKGNHHTHLQEGQEGGSGEL